MVNIMVEAVSGAEGLREDFLIDYFAAEAEKYRLQVIGLQGFINETWDQNEHR